MLVVLRDYKVLIGYLRSVDQFGKLLCLLRTMYGVCVQQQKPDGTVGCRCLQKSLYMSVFTS